MAQLYGISALALVASFAVSVPAASADEVRDYYTGRTLTLIGGAGAAGSYGFWGRLISDHLGKYIPGEPSIVFQAMPGAGGAKAANYLYNAAPKDGSVIGLLLKYVAMEQAIGRPNVRYDVRHFNWLISTGPINSVVAMWHTAPATTMEDLRNVETIMGSSGRSSETYITPVLMNAFLGTKFKVITGYPGTGEIHVAMENGEIHGRAAAWEGIRGGLPHWIAEKRVVLVAQSGLHKNFDLPDVPTLVDLATNEESRQIFEFIGSGSTLGRVFVAPPDVPKPRVAALRRAFEEVIKDSKFIAGVEARKLDFEPRLYAEVEDLVMRTINAPPEVIRKTREAIE
jgi:tripartite-type tricarboxylate transporter receptor subunit TctC